MQRADARLVFTGGNRVNRAVSGDAVGGRGAGNEDSAGTGVVG